MKGIFNQPDKKKHFIVGAFLGFFMTIVVAVLAGFFKEVYDRKNGGKFDCDDFVATILGGLVGQIIFILLI